MNINDQPKLAQLLEEMCAMFGRPYGEALLRGYYRTLKDHSFEAVSRGVLSLLANSGRPQVMPSAAEIKDVARHFERARGPSLEEERWRRRYDVWQRGEFSDDALGKAMAMTDGELGVGAEAEATQTYMPCQQPHCPSLIEWPTARTDEGRMYCPHHQPLEGSGAPALKAEKIDILRRLTPSGRAFMRSICGVSPEVAALMAEIPVTDEEREAAEVASLPRRAKAFELTAEGTGVNPKLFLSGQVTEDASWLEGYRHGADMMAAAGFRYDAEQAVWKRGRRTITDDQLGRMDEEVLRLFVGRR